ncbi:protein kinase domain-containing protein [Candidatus Uabimicrobium amorphum]|uniref:non-specific serine/threonine protein kinase n=1 Tax=Uabimicrobium amorphum TaxID=2596890 RepID=A0A5S9IKA7_UABAM|nr:PQQ-binding-like beta-propeller repeat protein [Candidatus Uabimicrobium amorphum]BBM83449.1 protein kinase [Candidatus Uabimicrobium amorphum]
MDENLENSGTNEFDNTILEVGKSTPTGKSLEGREFGCYKVLAEIGRGGMGVVYKAYDSKLERVVALKVSLQENDERFLREATTMAKLSHPNIIGIYGLGTENHRPYFIMEYIDGISLRQFLEKYSPSYKQIAEWMAAIGRAVDYAHKQGVIHRDLKPSNIMLANEKDPKVMDFGLAKDFSEQKQLSQTGMIIGSLFYMAPEQANGDIHNTDAKTDIYMLGAILYNMLAHRPPHEGSHVEILYKILHEEPIPPKDLIANVPVELEGICLKAMAKDKNKRYSSAEEMVDDLENFLNHQKISARPLGKWGRSVRKLKRNALTPWLFLALLANLVLLYMYYFQTQEKFPIDNVKVGVVDEKRQAKAVFSDNDTVLLDISWMASNVGNYTFVEVYGKDILFSSTKHKNTVGKNQIYIPVSMTEDISEEATVHVVFDLGKEHLKKEVAVKLNFSNMEGFRGGPERTGSFNEEGVETLTGVLWQQKVNFSVNKRLSSSPVIYGNNLYVVGQGVGISSQSLFCLNKNTGKENWRHNAIIKRDIGATIQSSPTITPRYISVCMNGDLYCLDKEYGDLQWRVIEVMTPEEKRRFGNVFIKSNGSPLAYKNKIFLGGENFHFVMNARNGKPMWRKNKFAWSRHIQDTGSDSLAMDDEKLYYYQGYTNFIPEKYDYVGARKRSDGEELWRWKLPTRSFSPTIPAVGEKNIYALVSNKLYCINKLEGKLVWEYKPKIRRFVCDIPAKYSQEFDQGKISRTLERELGSHFRVYYIRDSLKVVEKGKKWTGVMQNSGKTYSFELEGDLIKIWGEFTNVSCPALTEDSVYFASQDQHVYAVNRQDGKLRWKFKGGAEFYSSPTVARGIVYVGCDDNTFYALDAKNGTVKWKHEIEAKIRSSACVSEGKVYFMSVDGIVYALH